MNNSIEIFGQKISYPTSWPGAVAVFCFCLSLSVVVFLITKWLPPDKVVALGKIIDSQNQSQKALNMANTQLHEQVETLEEKLQDIIQSSSMDQETKLKTLRDIEALRGEREKVFKQLQQQESSQSNLLDLMEEKMGDKHQVMYLKAQQDLYADKLEQNLKKVQKRKFANSVSLVKK